MMAKNDRAAMLANFGKAVADLVTVAMEEMSDADKLSLGQALSNGGADLRLLVTPNPLQVICFLRATSVDAPPHILFSIAGDEPAGTSQ
jgi:hypothetical protein